MEKSAKWKIYFLEDYNVIVYESHAVTKFKAFMMGLIWRYIPDFTYDNRRYMVVDWKNTILPPRELDNAN